MTLVARCVKCKRPTRMTRVQHVPVRIAGRLSEKPKGECSVCGKKQFLLHEVRSAFSLLRFDEIAKPK